jgi:hypothetical protein
VPGLKNKLAGPNMITGVPVTEQSLAGAQGQNKKQRDKNYVADGW